VLGLLTVLLLSAGAGPAVAAMGPLSESDISGVDVSGGDMKFIREDAAIVIRGYATLSMADSVVKAENIVLFTETSEIYAEGDVSMREAGGNLFYCDALFYNLNTMAGEATNVRMVGTVPEEEGGGDAPEPTGMSDPLLGPGEKPGAFDDSSKMPINRAVVEADVARSTGHDHQVMHNVSVTTDPSASPIYRLTSQSARLQRNKKVETWHNVMWLGKMPVFYFPYIIKDLRYDWPWVRAAVGSNDDWGPYALTTWGVDLNPDPGSYLRFEKLFMHVDWRRDRGWGGGPAMEYSIGEDGEGTIDTYFISEEAVTAAEDRHRARTETRHGTLYGGEERGRIKWEHVQAFNENWDLRLNVHGYTDEDMQKEYFQRSFNEDKEPEAAVSLRRLDEDGDWLFEVVAKKRINSYLNQEEYLPEARFAVPGMQLGDTDLYLEADARIGVVNKRFDKHLNYGEIFNRYKVLGDDEYDPFFRAHAGARVYYPFKLGKGMTLTPYAGGVATYYGDVYDDTDGHTRGMGLYGATLQGRYYGFFNHGKLRHIIEPMIRYSANEEPTIEPDDLWQIDEIDTYREEHLLTLALRNKWQTKRDGRVVDLVDFDLVARYLTEDDEAVRYNGGEHWRDISLDMVVRPTDTLTLYGDLTYEPQYDDVSTAALGLDWRYKDRFRVDLTHRYNREFVDDYESNETTAALRWIASEKYAVEYAMAYEWADDSPWIDQGLSEYRLSIIRNLKVFELTLSVMRDVPEDETGVYLTLSPLGIAPLERAGTDEVTAARHGGGRYGPALAADEAELDAQQPAAPPLEAVPMP
jgi:hypothetical protein